jgi:hypothetical protein
MLKIQQTVSGAFRSDDGAAAFAHMRGHLSALSTQGSALVAALHALFAGQPVYSALCVSAQDVWENRQLDSDTAW